MAIQDTDLLLAYRPANKTHYKLSISDIPQELPDGTASGDVLTWDGNSWNAEQPTEELPDGVTSGDVLTWNGTTWNPVQPVNELPDGNAPGDYLRWDGAKWEPDATIDGGIYAT